MALIDKDIKMQKDGIVFGCESSKLSEEVKLACRRALAEIRLMTSCFKCYRDMTYQPGVGWFCPHCQ